MAPARISSLPLSPLAQILRIKSRMLRLSDIVKVPPSEMLCFRGGSWEEGCSLSFCDQFKTDVTSLGYIGLPIHPVHPTHTGAPPADRPSRPDARGGSTRGTPRMTAVTKSE